MSGEFFVSTTSKFDRELKKLASQHEDVVDRYIVILKTLKTDPFNRSRKYSIKKLEAVSAGDGQYRIRSGRLRFRYDIDGQTVYLKACSLRREDSYRRS